MIRRPEMLNRRKRENNTAFILLIVLLVVYLFILVADAWLNMEFFVVEVVGDSMRNTVYDGDLIYAERSFELKRGDIVIVDVTDYPEFGNGRNQNIIKRVIALEGDSLKCEDGIVYLKKGEGEYAPLEEPYLLGENLRHFREVELGEGEIFVMGDNRIISKDSRDAGPLREEDVIGVVPDWAVEHKAWITRWENLRGFFTNWLRKR